MADFGLQSDSGKIEKFAISPGKEKNAAFFVLKACFRGTEKKIFKRGGQHAALSDSAANVECLGHVAIESNGTLHVVVERLKKAQ